MKLLQIYNDYRSSHGGEKTVVETIASLIERNGGTAHLVSRSSKGLDSSLFGKMRCFAAGIYNPYARREMTQILRTKQPDIVHVHNVYPLLSPSVLVACRRHGVPVVMTHHNYQLTCPIVSHLHNGRVCDKCTGGREYWCALQNCRGRLTESFAYALRSAFARRLRLFHDNVTLHIALSQFAQGQLMRAGIEKRRIAVLPNMVRFTSLEGDIPWEQRNYAAFSGRMAPEKGIEVLLAAMKQLPEVTLRLAGDGPLLDPLRKDAPENTQFVGRLNPSEMVSFYRHARFVITPSTWFEGCPLVVSEAMSHGLPVIASRIGGLPEFVQDDHTGLLFEPGNVPQLTETIRRLWHDSAMNSRLGQAGRAKARNEYNEALYYQGLLNIYEHARRLCGKSPIMVHRSDARAPHFQMERAAADVCDSSHQ